MADHVGGKVIIVTGAGSGFGRLLSQKVAARGARVVCADLKVDTAEATVTGIVAAGGQAIAVAADVTSIRDMNEVARAAVSRYGRIDVMVNNAGIMPLAFFADHAAALEAWHRCIDINFKGVLNGMVAVHDQMMAQEGGHIINVSSIYGNFPVVGAGVYGATKAAVNLLSESLRMESRGRIKVTIVKPTGVPGTGLSSEVINPAAVVGIVGQNMPDYVRTRQAMLEGRLDPAQADAENPAYVLLDAHYIADAMVHAIDQPMGVSIGDITVRATGDHFLL